MVAVIAAPDAAGVETVTFTAPLTQGFGYGIIIGLGFAFALVMIFITWSLKRYVLSDIDFEQD
jgi:tetrahydromethanopterin S-methyltransferase subunit B